MPSARTGKHSEAATDPRGCIQSQPDPAQTAGRGHAAGVEEPLRQACFDPLLTLYVSDKSEAVLQKPNLYVPCQVLREIAYPTTSPDLHEIRYLHPGLLGLAQNPGNIGHERLKVPLQFLDANSRLPNLSASPRACMGGPFVARELPEGRQTQSCGRRMRA